MTDWKAIVEWVGFALGSLLAVGAGVSLRVIVGRGKRRSLTGQEFGVSLALAFPIALGLVVAGATLGLLLK